MRGRPQGDRAAGNRHIAVHRAVHGQVAAKQDSTAIDRCAFFNGGGTAKDQQVTVHGLAALQRKGLAKDHLALEGTIGGARRLQRQEEQDCQ